MHAVPPRAAAVLTVQFDNRRRSTTRGNANRRILETLATKVFLVPVSQARTRGRGRERSHCRCCAPRRVCTPPPPAAVLLHYNGLLNLSQCDGVRVQMM